MAIDNTGISSLDAGAGEITYSGNEGPKSPEQELMAQADPQIVEMYQQYVFEMEEQGMQPISFRKFLDQIMSESRMAEGGIARLGLRRGGNPHAGGYGPTADSTSRGPAGGASAGGNYGGNRNPNQGYADPGPVSHHHTVDTPKQIADQKKLDLMYATTGTGSDPDEKIDTPPEEDNWFKKQLDSRSKFLYNVVPNKFSWTYDKRKAFFNTLSDAQKKALGYGKHFESDWDDLEEWEKNMLMDYDVYSDFNKLGYQDWLAKDYEDKFGPRGGGDGQGITSQYPYPYQTASAPGTDTPVDPVTGFPVDPIRFASSQPSAHDFTGIYGQRTIPVKDGGRIGYAGGGIADLRQAYGLGKLVKKIGKTIKKVAKSPIGMAALGTLGGGLLGFGPAAGLKGSSLGKFLMGTGLPIGPRQGPSTGILGKMLLQSGKDWGWSNISPWKAIGGLSTLGGLYTSMTNKEDEEDDLMKKWLADKAMWDQQFAPVGDPANFQRIRFAADGGRIGYANAGSVDTDKMKEDLSTILGTTLPGKIGTGIASIANKAEGLAGTKEAEIMETINRLLRFGPAGGLAEVIRFIVDRYKIDPAIAERMVKLQMSDANMPIDESGTADEGYRPEIGIDAGAEDPWNIPKQKTMKDISINDIRDWVKKNPRKIKPIPMPGREPTPLHPDATKIPHHLDVNPLQTMEFRDANQDGIEDRSQGIYDKPRDLVPWDFNKPKYLAQGGRSRKQEGGLMDLGGMEKDYRNDGGFVPIGGQERADDVPARLSKNEFVFTADAVRAAGGGDIDKGAEVMENVMENLEKGGNVSEESQGLEGARNMFATSQRLEGVL